MEDFQQCMLVKTQEKNFWHPMRADSPENGTDGRVKGAVQGRAGQGRARYGKGEVGRINTGASSHGKISAICQVVTQDQRWCLSMALYYSP